MKLKVSLINVFPSKNKENGLERNSCQKKLLEKYCTSKLCGGFKDVPERMMTTQSTKKHVMELRIKLDNLKEAMSNN